MYQWGLNNKATDALSRLTPEAEMRILTAPSILDSLTVQREVESDEELQAIIIKLQGYGGGTEVSTRTRKTIIQGEVSTISHLDSDSITSTNVP